MNDEERAAQLVSIATPIAAELVSLYVNPAMSAEQILAVFRFVSDQSLGIAIRIVDGSHEVVARMNERDAQIKREAQ